MKKRILSIMLAVLLVLGLMPTKSFALVTGYTALDGSGGFDGEGHDKIFDGDDGSKWCMQFKGSAYVIFETSTSVNVSGYSFTTGNDNSGNPGRNPKNWVLYGCNDYTGTDTDTGSWVEIHSVQDDTVMKDKDYETYDFLFEKIETAYKYFKLEISAIHSGNVMQLSEFALTDCDHTWSSSVTEPTCTTEGYTSITCSKCKKLKEITNYTAALTHDISSEDGKCKYCGETEDEIITHVYDISQGSVIISDDANNEGRIKISYGGGQTRENVDPKLKITITGSTSSNELHVDTATPVSIRARNLTINSGSRNYCTAFVIGGAGGVADVTLILEGDNTFIGGFKRAGLQVEQGRKLTVTGSGTLTANGGKDGAGIGAGENGNCGTVIINSGTVRATGHTNAAGIGGGGNNSSSGSISQGGAITIKGGTVIAKSKNGAGIGGGAGYIGGNGGTVIIDGGNVTAISTARSAGIGGGSGSGLGDGNGGTVTINGGTVIANGVYGAGIGGGGYSSGGSGGKVTVTGGNVTANSSYGAGIGGSYGSKLNDGNGGVGDSGSFVTDNGNAVIFTSSIGDQSGKAEDAQNPWSGVIFEGDEGKVYGTCVTPSEDFTIKSGKTLTMEEDQALIISKDMLLTNDGTITNNGKIYVDGTFVGTADNLYYPINLLNASVVGDTSEYDGKIYGKAGSMLTLTPPDGKIGYLALISVLNPEIDIDNNNSFVMPDSALTVEADWKDITVPTGEISIGANSWDSINSSVDFDLFFNTAQEVTITAEDNSSDTVTIEYLLSANEISSDELDTLSFNTYTEPITISPDSEYVIYAKLTDASGNVAYINSTGIVLDSVAPVISGVENGKTYCSAQTVTVTEEYIASVTVNGVEVTLDNNNQFTRFPAESEQKIVVTDKAGNTAEMTVTVNDGHTYEWQSENGQYWSKCTFCDDETAKKDIPEITIDGADTVYRTEDYKFSFTLPESIISATYGYGFGNKGEGGLEPTIEDGKMSAIIPADIYEPSENSLTIIVEAITDDGFVISISKVISIIAVGDIDSDEEVKMLDVVLVQKAIAKLVELTPEQKAAADVNGDKQITMVDVVLIQRYIAKLITSFDTVKSK